MDNGPDRLWTGSSNGYAIPASHVCLGVVIVGQPSSHAHTGCADSEIVAACVDQRFDDFDAQSGQLAGHDQEYVQLSPGAFRGRFVSAFLGGGTSLHLETANRALAQRVGCPNGLISLGLVVGHGPSFRANGVELGGDQLLITNPGCELSLHSPAGGKILAICIEQSALDRVAAGGELPRPLDPSAGRIAVIEAPVLAARLRGAALDLLRAVRARGRPAVRGNVARPLAAAIEAEFALHEAVRDRWTSGPRAGDYRTFVKAKAVMATGAMAEFDYARLSEATSRSARSIQLAFLRHAGITPLRYFRSVKLTEARRALLSCRKGQRTVGDIAAECGFWCHSRFAQLYRRQFGELPSQTMDRGAAEPA